ncbi:MAG TPA: TlpA family protein disulfide reductase [Elusimicrobia bacterium]|nr:MAG: hypothetical protein A2278_02205 [Elusimicrobia bacterium RIFOXYA12_FULL_49_49]OGS10168.1 MAG: hypothetical protein A2204_00500 [Elusimicrobia bacterium RIFOXYA1_FULL_47_7]OGS16860.1 MAG: hypothetical protein A2251_05655 [Elusimicrobia bacterium RIFOXYA2_FULL_47_53]OGS32088.1 MAG: hypothetical protein A2323_08430 [Elusimicrobia bacterium RIFOXYB2_FULL_46_23]HBU69981.1 TlpA family protein disulfide reductase [Elusimicrobiota bacterium]
MLYFKTVIAAAITMASLASFAFAENIKAPDFTLLDVNGKKVTLSEARGKVVFIDFWASWCPPCRASIPAVEKLYDKYKGKDVEFYGINLEGNTPAIRKFIEKNSMKYTVLFDDRKASAYYEVRGIPSFFIINKAGEVHSNYAGYDPEYVNHWDEAIETLLKEAAPKGSKTPSKKLSK